MRIAVAGAHVMHADRMKARLTRRAGMFVSFFSCGGWVVVVLMVVAVLSQGLDDHQLQITGGALRSDRRRRPPVADCRYRPAGG
jgi:hypothetical protein